jgi:hypothetical protein
MNDTTPKFEPAAEHYEPQEDIKRINSWVLQFSWDDGLNETMCASLPEYIRDEINTYLNELEQHQAEVGTEYNVANEDGTQE